MQHRPVNIPQLLTIVEMSGPQIPPRMPYDLAVRALEGWKEVLKKQRKLLAKKYHPDRGGSVEKMQEINSAVDLLLALEVQRRQPQPRVVYFYSSGTSATTSTAASFMFRW